MIAAIGERKTSSRKGRAISSARSVRRNAMPPTRQRWLSELRLASDRVFRGHLPTCLPLWAQATPGANGNLASGACLLV
jgi:hypothetical protein